MMGKRRAALARMQRVIKRAEVRQALIEQAISPTPFASEAAVAASSPPLQLSPYDQARVAKWIADRLIDWPSTSCLHCRKPIIAGQPWIPVSNGEVTARFHQDCHSEWLEQQEVAARRALGLGL
jgi:hypothetical protein